MRGRRHHGSALALAAAALATCLGPSLLGAQPRPRVISVPVRGPDELRPWLGISYTPASGSVGVRVIEVYEESAAAAAGLTVGDVIIDIDGVTLVAPDLLPLLVARQRVGDVVSLTIARNGRARRVGATLTARLEESELLYRRLVGRLAPPIALMQLDGGSTVVPSSSPATVTVLAWFALRANDIAPIAAELAAWRDRAGSADVDLIAATEGESEAVRAFVARTPLAIAVAYEDPAKLAATDTTAIARYTVERSTHPAATVVVIDHRGIVRFAAAIDEGDHVGLDDALAAADRAIAVARHDR